MAHLMLDVQPKSEYWDKKQASSREDWFQKLRVSTCVYVGNLSFNTNEDILYEWFSRCGEVTKIVIGLNGVTRAPCGFAFVVMKSNSEAHTACRTLSGMYIDNRPIRVDMDSGDNIESEHRKFGRGRSGAQWRDEFRENYDGERGGHGGGLDYEAECDRLLQESKASGNFRRNESRGPYSSASYNRNRSRNDRYNSYDTNRNQGYDRHQSNGEYGGRRDRSRER